MDLQTGEYYDVPCAELMNADDGRIYYVPVLDHLHMDTQFGFPEAHYHIDGRFEIHPRLKHYYNISDGITSSVIAPAQSKVYKFIGIVSQQLRCERSLTGLAVPEYNQSYEDWYAGYVGRKCAGDKCPHYGKKILERDGFLFCPMHGLTADVKTKKIIERHAVTKGSKSMDQAQKPAK